MAFPDQDFINEHGGLVSLDIMERSFIKEHRAYSTARGPVFQKVQELISESKQDSAFRLLRFIVRDKISIWKYNFPSFLVPPEPSLVSPPITSLSEDSTFLQRIGIGITPPLRKELVFSEDHVDVLILIESRFNRYHEENMLGLDPPQSQLNKITLDLLQYLRKTINLAENFTLKEFNSPIYSLSIDNSFDH